MRITQELQFRAIGEKLVDATKLRRFNLCHRREIGRHNEVKVFQFTPEAKFGRTARRQGWQNKTKSLQSDIRFLLKDKYRLNELKIQEYMIRPSKAPQNIKNDIQKLVNGKPLAYIIGHVDFINIHVDLSYKPLIPRPETEHWVNTSINELKKIKTNYNTLDLYSGSGCIGLAIIKNINCYVTFADISDNSIKQISKNIDINKIDSSKYQIRQSDRFKNISEQFDIIFANPPYIDEKTYKNKKLQYEPTEALYSREGTQEIHLFLEQALNHLKKGGRIYMEFGHNQKPKVEQILKKYKYKNWTFNKDQYGKDRWVKINF